MEHHRVAVDQVSLPTSNTHISAGGSSLICTVCQRVIFHPLSGCASGRLFLYNSFNFVHDNQKGLLRHIGPNEEEVRAMLRDVGFDSVGALIDATVPKDIRLGRQLNLPEAKSEFTRSGKKTAIPVPVRSYQ